MNVSLVAPSDVAALLTPAGWIEPRPGTLRDQPVEWWTGDGTGLGLSRLPSLVFEDVDGNTVVVPKSVVFGVRLVRKLAPPAPAAEHAAPLAGEVILSAGAAPDPGEVLGLNRGERHW